MDTPHPLQTHLGPGAESFLCSGLVGSFAQPGGKGRGLECAAIREGQLPGPVEGCLVDGIQIEGGLLLTLTSRQEADAWQEGTNVRVVWHNLYSTLFYSSDRFSNLRLLTLQSF